MELVLSLADLGLIVFLVFYFQSIWMGNPHVRRLVHCLSLSDHDGYIIQLAKIPRLKSGFWAFTEDADDIGLLSLTDDRLVFKGDSIEFSFPYTHIKNICKKNVGWRGAWTSGNRIRIDISDPSGEKSFEFLERSSLTNPASRKITRELFNSLSVKIQK